LNCTHIDPLQQPVVQVDGLQTQLPLVQLVPIPQVTQFCPLMPQVCIPEGWQAPEVSRQKLPVQAQPPWALQVKLVLHVEHMPPFAPHICGEVVVTHCPLLQQPAQLEVPPQLHAPLVHVVPVEHLPQALPPDPQASIDWPVVTQLFWVSQQPLGQEVVVQVQAPVEVSQAWPVMQPPHIAPR
jgi:hypothetical protein